MSYKLIPYAGRKAHKNQDDSQVIESKWPFWMALAWVALAAVCVWLSKLHFENHRFTEVGKAVDCSGRPSYEYFSWCNPQADGAACMLASQSRMMQWYDPIDEACAAFEPKRAFRFHVPNPDRDTQEIAAIQ